MVGYDVRGCTEQEEKDDDGSVCSFLALRGRGGLLRNRFVQLGIAGLLVSDSQESKHLETQHTGRLGGQIPKSSDPSGLANGSDGIRRSRRIPSSSEPKTS